MTKASSPTAGTGLPIKWYWSGLLGRTSSVTVILKCLSPIRSQYVTYLLVVAPPISPSVTERFSTGSSRCSEAFSIRTRRAFAEAWRSAMPLLSKELLPAVYPSLGEFVRICCQDRDPSGVNIKFFCHNHAQRGCQLLAQFNLAGINRDSSVSVELQPGVQVRIIAETR